MMTTEDLLEELAQQVFSELGFAPTDLLRQRLGRVVRQRMKAVGAPDLRAYLSFLEISGRDELTRLVQALTINETYFFREPAHFAALERLLPELAARSQRVRLLSAGCATGEEAYSLAITAWRVLGGRPEAFEVVGVDIDEAALARAREGLYGPWSFREDSFSRAAQFLRAEGDRWRVVPALRSLVRFERLNLVEAVPEGPFQVVFCRNMLMYLTPENRRAVVERLTQQLAPGGVFFVGSAESLEWGPPDLKRVRAHGAFFYQKAEAAPPRTGRLLLVSPSPLVRVLWRQVARSAGSPEPVVLADWRSLRRGAAEHRPELVVVDAPAGEEGAVAALLQSLPDRCRRILLVRDGATVPRPLPGVEVVGLKSVSPNDLRSWLEGLLAGGRPTEGPAQVHRRAERLLLIGCSTGGPPVVTQVMAELPAGLGLAVIVVQHMPAGFTRSFAERLNRVSAYRVREAADGAELAADAAFVAPGQRNLVLGRAGTLRVLRPDPADLYVPNINRTFLSVAAGPLGPRTFAVLLTGMGNDGAEGLKALAEAGAETAVQDPTEALIPAMVNAALGRGAPKQVLKTADIARAVAAWAGAKPLPGGSP
jgi:chemotaxis methyl-accepting protein methylase